MYRGTRHLLDACLTYPVKRLVYVSSVHALPEKDRFHVLQEVKRFSPESVVGGYAKTKAEATQAVLDAVSDGLDAVIVQPSGILGPYDTTRNHLVQLVSDYVHGRLPACVRGGYDFVDVRDVAQGCLSALENGKTGECYILSNRHYEIKEILRMIRFLQGGRRVPSLPCGWPKSRRRLSRCGPNAITAALSIPGIRFTPCTATINSHTTRLRGNWDTSPEIYIRRWRIPWRGFREKKKAFRPFNFVGRCTWFLIRKGMSRHPLDRFSSWT